MRGNPVGDTTKGVGLMRTDNASAESYVKDLKEYGLIGIQLVISESLTQADWG